MQAAQPAGYTRPGARAWKAVHGRSIGFASRLAGQHQGCRPRRLEPSAVADTARACLSLFSRLTCAFFDHARQGPKSVQNLLELGLALLEGRVFAVDIMHLHLEGHRRHSAVGAGLGDQVIALLWLPVGVFRVASLETGTDQAAGLIAEGDIPRAEAINLQQAGISVWYQTPHGHAEKLTGRRLIDSIEQCRGAARAPLLPEVKRLIAAVGDKAEGYAHAGFGGNFMFRAGAKTGQEIQRGRLQAGLFAAWLVVFCLLWGRRALQGAAEGIGNNQRPLIIKGVWRGLGDAHTRQTEVDVAYNFLRTFVRALRVSDFGVFPIPGFGKPVVDPFLAVVGHIVKT